MESTRTMSHEIDPASLQQFTEAIQKIISVDLGVDRTFTRTCHVGIAGRDYKLFDIVQEITQSHRDQTGKVYEETPPPDDALKPDIEWFERAERESEEPLCTIHFYTFDDTDGTPQIDGIPTLSPTNDRFVMEYRDPRDDSIHTADDESFADDQNELIEYLLAELRTPDTITTSRAWSRDSEEDTPTPLTDTDILWVCIEDAYDEVDGHNTSFSVTFYNGVSFVLDKSGVKCFDINDDEVPAEEFVPEFETYLKSLQRYPLLAGEVHEQ